MYPFDNLKSRITLNMSVLDALVAMCDGNPGALSVCTQLLKEGEAIDPQAFMGGFGTIMFLDTCRIYGPRIWMLYKDVCKQDLRKTCAVLRALQLGLLDDAVLQSAIDNYGQGIDVDALCAQVKERLPSFQLGSV